MIGVGEYISLVMQKKGISSTQLLNRLNDIEKRLGDKKTRLPNISKIINGGGDGCEAVTLVKYEKALDLPEGTLYKMVSQPIDKEAKKRLSEFIKRVREIK